MYLRHNFNPPLMKRNGVPNVFDFETLNETELECEECGWTGKGYETDKEYTALPAAIELYCPVCKNYFGVVCTQREGGE